jgi:hypothetical protein
MMTTRWSSTVSGFPYGYCGSEAGGATKATVRPVYRA